VTVVVRLLIFINVVAFFLIADSQFRAENNHDRALDHVDHAQIVLHRTTSVPVRREQRAGLHTSSGGRADHRQVSDEARGRPGKNLVYNQNYVDK